MYPIFFRIPDFVPLLGGAPITSFGVMMFLSFLTGGFILRSELERKGHDPEKAWDMVFMGVIGGIVGAKLYYVLLNWQDTLANPAGMIFSRGGMVWYGGFLGATALVIWEVRRSKLPLGGAADATAPALALAYAVGRIGCFLVGDDWGRPTDLPWAIRFPQGAPPTSVPIIERQFGIQVDPALVEKYGQIVPVHPTQLYEVGLSSLFFVILWRIRDHERAPGWLFMLWLVMAGFERFLVEFFRAKDDRFLGVFTIAQVISLALAAFGAAGMIRLGGAGKGAPPSAGERVRGSRARV